MGVVSWVVAGLLVGVLVGRVARLRFPGGAVGAILAAVAGGFLGGAIFTIVAGGRGSAIDIPSLLLAFAGAALLLLIVQKADDAAARSP